MQKFGKQALALMLVLMLLFGVTACNDTPAVSDPESETVSAEASEGGDAVSDAESVGDAASVEGETSATDTALPSGDETTDSTTGSADKGGTGVKPTSSTTKKTTTTTKKTPTKTVKFTDLDLSNLDALTEAPGADSGENGTLYVLDTENMRERLPSIDHYYDATKFAVSLQGLENRNGVSIYMKDLSSDTWLTFLRAYNDGLLYGKKIVTVKTIDAFVEKLGDKIKAHGLVVWDPAQPFTSNIATNVCGVEGYLPVMYSEDEDSLYVQLTEEYGASIVKMDLCGKFTGKKGSKIWDTNITSTGSAKNDAYLWAMEKYVKTNKTSKEYIAYMCDYYPLSENGSGQYLDNSIYESYLPSQDFVVANKIFTFDLSIMKNEASNDDPQTQVGLDYQTLTKLLQYQYDRNNGKFSRCIGFPPFPYKYTGDKAGVNDSTMIEWTTVEVMTAYNIAVEADCPGPSSLYNCSVFSQHKQQVQWTQSAKRQKALSSLPKYDKNTSYLYFFMGDYDAVSWTYHSAANRIWKDKNRGDVPLGWAFNPNLSQRIPMVWDYFYATATDNDYFIAGDSGAGYINPNLLQEGKRKFSDLPDGLSAWAEFCTTWYKKTDITITGMILDGNNGYATDKVLKSFSAFSPDGIGIWNWPNGDSGLSVVNGVGVSGMEQGWHITGHYEFNAETGSDMLIDLIDSRRELNFYPVKCCLNTPTQVEQVVKLAQQKLDAQGKGRKIEVVDPYTFFAMIARDLK